jgi:hypothetical protein
MKFTTSPAAMAANCPSSGGGVAVLDNDVERARIHQERTDIHGEKSGDVAYPQTGMACKRPSAVPEQAVRHSPCISQD